MKKTKTPTAHKRVSVLKAQQQLELAYTDSPKTIDLSFEPLVNY